MIRIAITGGIGSGKSYVVKLLKKRGIEVYDCDSEAKRLMASSDDVRRRLTDLIGPDAYSGDVLNKKVVADFLLASEDNAKRIEAIVHPAVGEDFLNSGKQWVESAILFQSGFDRYVDKAVCVTAPLDIRIGRVMARDSVSREKALQWIERQWPQEEVLARCDFEIVNDGVADLDIQIDRLLDELKRI